MTFLPATNTDILAASSLSHVAGFTAYADWYTLRDQLVPYIGERAMALFCYSIADAQNSLVSSAFFKKVLIDSGENVDNPQVTETEQLLIDWGRQIAVTPESIPESMYEKLEAAFNPRLRLILVAFAGLTVASNLLNTVGRIPLEESLYTYRKTGDDRTR